ncbi:FAD-binding oxidoreductase [Taibaiella lutea]|uniref:FAD-binding oxidoreductase n=1 Tax=Taibaiella lutea TaxID=2608001 RepID=A0A5M6CE33_9BACT|nr:FAD-dependent oxidoreductase [Taibaiella lutea]KAA5533307.1 FAD-binding oxidoreductase [Taibaiella lutea]
MSSYWEQQSLLHYDHIIIGSGIVGLHTAIELKERFPHAQVLVLERSLFPFGASTRNAGFACMGSFTELSDDLASVSEQDMVDLFLKRKAGLELLRKRLGDTAIGYKENGSYELISKAEMPLLERFSYLNELIENATGIIPFKVTANKIKPFGFNASLVESMIENTMEGEIHTGKMMRALVQYAIKSGIEIKTGAIVEAFEEEEKKVVVFVKDNTRKTLLPLSCEKLFICTNAFSKQLLPDISLQPGRGQVLVTEPITGLPFKGIFHFDKGYYYFREIDGRVLLGGGRNLDFEGERTTDIELNENIQSHLIRLLKEMILPDHTFEIAQQWSGIMAFGEDKRPIVKSFSDKIYGAFRMGGMGVALGAGTAKELVDLVLFH